MSKKHADENLEADPVPSKELATVSHGGLALFGKLAPSTKLATSFDLTDDTEAAKAYLAKEKSSVAIASLVDSTIVVEHVLAHEAHTINQETGEIVDLVRMVLVGPDGKQYDTVSEGVRACMGVICIENGPPPWNPALKLRVFRSGRMLRLEKV